MEQRPRSTHCLELAAKSQVMTSTATTFRTARAEQKLQAMDRSRVPIAAWALERPTSRQDWAFVRSAGHRCSTTATHAALTPAAQILQCERTSCALHPSTPN